MDGEMMGKLIQRLRLEKGFTQRELAEKLHISDRTISKWERGAGCPDISILPKLAAILEVNSDQLLSGSLKDNFSGGNMKRIKFYSCPQCGNLMHSTASAELSCCGRKLSPLKAVPGDEEHSLQCEEIENELFISINHPMEKEHFISFVAFVSYDRVLLIKLYPEQNAQLRIPKLARGTLYLCCSKHGLMCCKDLNRNKEREKMILSDRKLEELIKSGALGVSPFEPMQIQAASMDIRLGSTYSTVEEASKSILSMDSEISYKTITADSYVLLPGQFVLASTMEYVRLPNNLTAFVEGRSSIGRLGLFIQNAGWVDPGFEGEITLELFNASRYAIELKAGRRIGQLVFAQLDQNAKSPYHGKYQGQKGATGSRINMDAEIG